jgi:hypothetical protein
MIETLLVIGLSSVMRVYLVRFHLSFKLHPNEPKSKFRILRGLGSASGYVFLPELA